MLLLRLQWRARMLLSRFEALELACGCCCKDVPGRMFLLRLETLVASAVGFSLATDAKDVDVSAPRALHTDEKDVASNQTMNEAQHVLVESLGREKEVPRDHLELPDARDAKEGPHKYIEFHVDVDLDFACVVGCC